jgi:hypothetical protein
VPRENAKTNVDWQVYLSDFSLTQFKELMLSAATPIGAFLLAPRRAIFR